MTTVKKNIIYNILYNVLILVVPLITAPYISRIIGATGVGIYSYTYSIAQYFVLFSMLGLNNYGNRTIAKCRNNKEELSRNFWSIYYMQLITCCFFTVLFIILCFLEQSELKIMFIIQGLYIISSFFDINWFFFGIERFKLITIRNSVVKIISMILIFVLVKSKNDLWIYTLIIALSTLVSQIMLWPFLKSQVNYSKIYYKDIKKHFIPNATLFIPVIAVSLYNVMDKIMLGLITSKSEVGFYENAEKIISVPTSIINSIGIVMLPRISNLITDGNNKQIYKYIERTIEFAAFLAFPIFLGLIIIGNDFSIIYFGNEFEKTGFLIQILSIIIVFKVFANIVRTQYLLPNEKDKIYVSSVCIGAIINIIANMLLIPKFKSVGACIGTILAEFFVMLYQCYKSRNYFMYKSLLKNIIPYIYKSAIMCGCIYLINYINIESLTKIIMQIILGCLIYFVLNKKYCCNILKGENK